MSGYLFPRTPPPPPQAQGSLAEEPSSGGPGLGTVIFVVAAAAGVTWYLAHGREHGLAVQLLKPRAKGSAPKSPEPREVGRPDRAAETPLLRLDRPKEF